MIIGVCSGGPTEEIYLPPCDEWIGVDRGALYLVENGIVPLDIVGDFDSVTSQDLARLRLAVPMMEQVKAEKDETDTELAIEKAIAMKPKRIIITGVTGGRLDHFEAAVRILARYQLAFPAISFSIVNASNEISVLTPGHHTVSKSNYHFLSFFALDGAVEQVTLRGVKYETTAETIERFGSRFTSNEIIADKASIFFSSGICLMIRSND